MQSSNTKSLRQEEREEGSKWLGAVMTWFQTASVFTLAVVGVLFITFSIGFTNLNPRDDLLNKARKARTNVPIVASNTAPLSKN